eukprot:c7878_g1_i1.p1 GENE.c7878_g1_i1~~c7878_g1_i1.p1  ORF type:complete len:236 (-),score=29.23 c7878_g1_i1:89-796(-)
MAMHMDQMAELNHMGVPGVSHMQHMQHMQHLDVDHSQVPSFLTKTWDIVNDPDTDHIISWNETGMSFIIHDTTAFLTDVVPKHFKHNNLASFIRQLNIYGFQKVGNKHVCEFRHDLFRAKERHLLSQIKRKTPTKRMQFDDDDDEMSSVKTEAILTELLQLKQRQDLLEMNLVQAMNTNDSLWSDLAACKQQQREIQDNLQKTLYFLMTVHGAGDDKKSLVDVGAHMSGHDGSHN